MREDHERTSSLLARFGAADESALIAMWKAGTNEEGKPLTRFGFMTGAVPITWLR